MKRLRKGRDGDLSTTNPKEFCGDNFSGDDLSQERKSQILSDTIRSAIVYRKSAHADTDTRCDAVASKCSPTERTRFFAPPVLEVVSGESIVTRCS